MPETLDQVLAALPQRFPGAGGAVAVIREGQIVARHAWGFADLERRIPFTPQTMFLICSISKQFTCATAQMTADLDRTPDALEARWPSGCRAFRSAPPRRCWRTTNRACATTGR